MSFFNFNEIYGKSFIPYIFEILALPLELVLKNGMSRWG